MRFLLVGLLLIVVNSSGQVEPCSTYTCDSLAVRAILDSNGLDTVSVREVVSDAIVFGDKTFESEGRISLLSIREGELSG